MLPGPPLATIAPKVIRRPAHATPSTTVGFWARRWIVERTRSSSARRRSRMRRSVAALISACVLVLIGFPFRAVAERDPEEDREAREQRQQNRHVEDPKDEPGVRDPQLLGPDDVVVGGIPEVRSGPVVALH